MKSIKKIAIFSLILGSFAIVAMQAPTESVERAKKEAVRAAAQKPSLTDFVVEEFKPNRDKKEVFKLYKDAWTTNLGHNNYPETITVGGQGNSRVISTEQWLADHLINPVATGPDYKYVDVARNTQAPEDSKILGIVTYYMAFKKPENPAERQRGYIETLISKPSLSEADRKAVEKALLARVFNQIKEYNPEFYEKQLREANTVSVEVFKEAGFKEVGKGKDGQGNVWLKLERPNNP